MTSEQIKKKLNLDNIGSFYEGRTWVTKNGKWGHVDRNGKVTTPIIYDDAGDFQEGRTWIKKNGKYGHVDLNGKVVGLIIYYYVGDFYEGKTWVRVNKVEFYINRQGYPTEHKDYYKLIKEIF